MAQGRLLGGLVLGLLAACQGPPPDDASRNGDDPPTVREVYVRALTALGPHRYPTFSFPRWCSTRRRRR
ncbi:MAG: hypothetical protein ACE5GT_01870 [Rhodospirillales bacterium]